MVSVVPHRRPPRKMRRARDDDHRVIPKDAVTPEKALLVDLVTNNSSTKGPFFLIVLVLRGNIL